MSTVHTVLRAAIEERISRSQLIRIDIEATELRIKEYKELEERNNQEMEELLDALESEADYLERISA